MSLEGKMNSSDSIRRHFLPQAAFCYSLQRSKHTKAVAYSIYAYRETDVIRGREREQRAAAAGRSEVARSSQLLSGHSGRPESTVACCPLVQSTSSTHQENSMGSFQCLRASGFRFFHIKVESDELSVCSKPFFAAIQILAPTFFAL